MYIQGQFPWHKLASDGDKKSQVSNYVLYVHTFWSIEKKKKFSVTFVTSQNASGNEMDSEILDRLGNRAPPRPF